MEDVREKMWMEKYAELKEYIIAHKHLPDKHKVENRGLLNWWKYNMKRKNKGLLVEERCLKNFRICVPRSILAVGQKENRERSVRKQVRMSDCRAGEQGNLAIVTYIAV